MVDIYSQSKNTSILWNYRHHLNNTDQYATKSSHYTENNETLGILNYKWISNYLTFQITTMDTGTLNKHRILVPRTQFEWFLEMLLLTPLLKIFFAQTFGIRDLREGIFGEYPFYSFIRAKLIFKNENLKLTCDFLALLVLD